MKERKEQDFPPELAYQRNNPIIWLLFASFPCLGYQNSCYGLPGARLTGSLQLLHLFHPFVIHQLKYLAVGKLSCLDTHQPSEFLITHVQTPILLLLYSGCFISEDLQVCFNQFFFEGSQAQLDLSLRLLLILIKQGCQASCSLSTLIFKVG